METGLQNTNSLFKVHLRIRKISSPSIEIFIVKFVSLNFPMWLYMIIFHQYTLHGYRDFSSKLVWGFIENNMSFSCCSGEKYGLIQSGVTCSMHCLLLLLQLLFSFRTLLRSPTSQTNWRTRPLRPALILLFPQSFLNSIQQNPF